MPSVNLRRFYRLYAIWGALFAPFTWLAAITGAVICFASLISSRTGPRALFQVVVLEMAAIGFVGVVVGAVVAYVALVRSNGTTYFYKPMRYSVVISVLCAACSVIAVAVHWRWVAGFVLSYGAVTLALFCVLEALSALIRLKCLGVAYRRRVQLG